MNKLGMQANIEKPIKMDALYDILYAYGYNKEDKIEIQKQEDKIEIQKQENKIEIQKQENNNTSTSKELDIKIGIEVCGGDKELYKDILNDFLNDYESSTTQIQNYLNKNDLESAQKMLLDITGITANIGAINIQDNIKELKEKLRSPEDKEYIEAFKKYASQFDNVMTEVRGYLLETPI
jgi:HPt (histidine-containing phosphotransfer) domain-containing protein